VKLLRHTIVASGIVSLLAACGGAPVKEEAAAAPADPYPEWYYAPASAVPNGLATASCKAIPGNAIDIARQQTIATGRADLANQIETRVKAMAKTFSEVTNTADGASVDETFTNVSKQIANQMLSGARAVKAQRVVDQGKTYFCSLVSLDPSATQSMIDQIVKKATGGTLSSDQESVLRARFLAEKAQKELEREIR